MATLYELKGDFLALMELAEDPDVDPQTFADTLEGLSGEIEEKVDSYGKVIENLKNGPIAELDGQIAAIEKTLDRLKNRKKGLENNVDRMKDNVKDIIETMYEAGTIPAKKVKTTLFTTWIQKNTPSVDLGEAKISDIPEEYLIPQEPKVDKAKILKDLKAGKELSFAKIKQTEGLRWN